MKINYTYKKHKFENVEQGEVFLDEYSIPYIKAWLGNADRYVGVNLNEGNIEDFEYETPVTLVDSELKIIK